MKRIMLTAAAAFATSFALLASVPEVTGVTMEQDSSRLVTITYDLADANAVVTLDVQTNATDGSWVSIGGEAIRNAQGDVWKQVATGQHSITWRPDLSWPDHKISDGGARAVVTAWSLDNTPDYMVVDLSDAAQPNTQEYYPTADFLPGGLLGNDDYRTTKIVMRKIMASGVKWTMGSTPQEERNRQADREATHAVTLSDNYYIGVFPVTQSQWVQVCSYNNSYFNNAEYCAMRPVEQVSYNEIRNPADGWNATNKTVAADEDYHYPKPPKSDSFLGMLRDKTGLAFDLPSEVQWEFAARAGNGVMKWGNGSGITNKDRDANLALLGRYQYSGGKPDGVNDPAQNCTATNGTAIVGSYAPNDWGLYDFHGNVWEWCLDWYADDIAGLEGAVNTAKSTKRVERGGSWSSLAGYARPAFRNSYEPYNRHRSVGFRIACPVGL